MNTVELDNYLQQLDNFIKLTETFGMEHVAKDLICFYPGTSRDLFQTLDSVFVYNDSIL